MSGFVVKFPNFDKELKINQALFDAKLCFGLQHRQLSDLVILKSSVVSVAI